MRCLQGCQLAMICKDKMTYEWGFPAFMVGGPPLLVFNQVLNMEKKLAILSSDNSTKVQVPSRNTEHTKWAKNLSTNIWQIRRIQQQIPGPFFRAFYCSEFSFYKRGNFKSLPRGSFWAGKTEKPNSRVLNAKERRWSFLPLPSSLATCREPN